MSETSFGEIDGVRSMWTEVPGQMIATLSFRVGQADESLGSRGVTHLCEHLLLSVFDNRSYAYNGSTGTTVTSFVVQGEPTEVQQHLSEVCRRLRSGQFLDRLDHERRILELEGRTRAYGIVTDHLCRRYGARSHGLVAYNEIGLHRLGRDDVWNWAATNFTRQNAVVTFSSPPPAGMELDLFDGVARGEAPPAPIASTLPAHVRADGPSGLTSLVERTTAAVAANAIYAQRVVTSLRHESGTSYSPMTDYVRLDGTNALAVTTADGPPTAGGRTAWTLWSVLGDVASSGATDDELDRHRQSVRRYNDEPYAPLGIMAAQADEVLHGATARTRAQYDEELNGLTVEAVTNQARAMWHSAIVSVPVQTEIPNWNLPEHHVAMPPRDPRAVAYERRTYQHVNNWSSADALLCGPTAMTLDAGDRSVTVGLSPRTLVLAYGDGSRTVIDRLGSEILLRPTAWVSGTELVAWLDSSVSDENLINVGARHLGPTGSEMEALRSVRGLGPGSSKRRRSRADGSFDESLLGPMRLDGWALDLEVPAELPDARRWMPSAVALGWLAHRQLLAPWLEACIPDTLAAFRSLQLGLLDLFGECGGALYTDLASSDAAPFLADLVVPPQPDEQAVFGSMIDRATGTKFEYWHLTESHAPAVWEQMDDCWARIDRRWSAELGSLLSPGVPPLRVPPSRCQPLG